MSGCGWLFVVSTRAILCSPKPANGTKTMRQGSERLTAGDESTVLQGGSVGDFPKRPWEEVGGIGTAGVRGIGNNRQLWQR